MNLDPIAIIGMAGRFPGAADVAQFWCNLREGVESVRFFNREELKARGVAAALLDDPLYVRAGAVLDGIELFDADFFGFTPREAEITDPQHRVFLECAFEALEDSGYDPEGYEGQIGVFAGAGLSTYLLNYVLRCPEVVRSVSPLQLQLGNNKDYVPLRVSYKLRLRGPSVNVNTACSSSLVAVHLACQSLLDYQCDMALAGGVGIQLPQDQGYLYAQNGIVSPDGHCRAFDAGAQGTVSGNGAGIVVLKRLAEALADGDSIRAVILGSAINNDGAAKVSFTAPSMEGQARVIAEALAVAEVDPETIGYVEAHGTGTPLGDPIEIAALTDVFRAHTDRARFCVVGSVKTNIGHLDEAAGIAGLIKTVLALQHAQIPPSLHYEKANAEIDFETSPFYVPTRPISWETDGVPRRAGVSSFGIGGTNAHVVLEEAPPSTPGSSARPWQLLFLSAKTDTVLDMLTARLADHLQRTPGIALADVAYTLHVGRKDFPHRRFLLCRDIDDAVRSLASRGGVTGRAQGSPRPLAFLFPGQGSQYVNMGLGLYRTEPVFRETLDHCAESLRSPLGFDLRTVLYPEERRAEEAAARLAQTAVAQPALFTVEYALARLWMSWGIKPQAMIGHSIGEYVAACVASVFSWEDALALVAVRGKLMQQMPAGGMLAVGLAEDELLPLLGKGLTLALVNAPSLCVVSGAIPALEALQSEVSARGIACQRLHTSHAFHSESMDPMLRPFTQRLQQVALQAPEIPYMSNLTGQWITAEQATDPDSWAQHLRHTARFSPGIQQLLTHGDYVFLEVGPGRTLSTLVKRHPQCTSEQLVLSTMRHPHEPRADTSWLLEAVGRLWLAGACRKPSSFYVHERRRRVVLPTYPFERQRYWIDPPASDVDEGRPAVSQDRSAGRAEKKADVSEWFYAPSWKRAPNWQKLACPDRPLDFAGSPTGWLMFVDDRGLGQELTERLRLAGQRVATVRIGPAFGRTSDNSFVLNPDCAEDYRTLVAELTHGGLVPSHIVHLWTLTPIVGRMANPDRAEAGSELHRAEEAQARGFYSLLYLVQALVGSDSSRTLRDEHGMHPVLLSVVSDGVCDVTGSEPLCPNNATLLGPLKVVPQEYPPIRCRLIDLGVPRPDSPPHGLLEELLGELTGEVTEPLVALRGSRRWVPTFDPVRLEEPLPGETGLRQRGMYVITGGLGGIGLILAEYLARTVQARLVLVGRNAPHAASRRVLGWRSNQDDQMGMDGTVERRPGFHLEPECAALEQAERQLDQSLNIPLLCAFDGLEDNVSRLCASYAYDFFRTNGLDVQPRSTYRRRDILAHLAILPSFERFVDFLLAMLAEDGMVRVCGDQIEFVQEPQQIPRSQHLREILRGRYPGFAGMLALLDHCARHYRDALSGRIPAIGVLYPDGKPDLFEEAGRQTVPYGRREVCLRLLGHTIMRMAHKTGRKLRILEAGVGDGILARSLVAELVQLDLEYFVTDIGRSFVLQRQREAQAAGLDFFKFGVLDISCDPREQGYEVGTFDLVMALDVVHATRHLRDTIGNLRKLLRPNGLIALIEAVQTPRWLSMIWGLAEAWWQFEDTEIRQRSPLISIEQWEQVFRQQGFQHVATWPRSQPTRSQTDYGLILAQRTAPPTSFIVSASLPASASKDAAPTADHRTRQIARLEQLGAEVHVVQADVADERRMCQIMDEVQQRFGRIDGVIHAAGETRREILFNRITELKREQVEALFRGRILGTRTLEKVLLGRPLDFCLLISSNAATLGGQGLCAYAAASAYMDALAMNRCRQRGQRWISTNWDSWPTEVHAGQQQSFFTGIDRYGMNLDESHAAFRRIVAQASGQVVVSSADLHSRWKYWSGMSTSRALPWPSDPSAGHTEPADAFHRRPDLSTSYVPPGTEYERTLVDIWQDLLGIDRVGIHDNFFELGGDSLLGTQLIARVARVLKIDLPFLSLFERPTVDGLAVQIEQLHAARRLVALPSSDAGADEEEGEI
jgi:acyl transferase domain-containing protein